jgi:type IV pilus assembly protein PilQ
MAGMKTRFTSIKYYLMENAKARSLGILTLWLAFMLPITMAQDKTVKNAAANPAASAATPAGFVVDVKFAPENDRTVVTLTTDRLLTPIESRLDNPSRLVLDFKNIGKKFPSAQLPVNSPSLKRIRMRQSQDPDLNTRIVFDLGEAFKSYDIALDRTSVQVVFRQGQPPAAAAPADKELSAPIAAKTPSKAAQPKPNLDSPGIKAAQPQAAAANMKNSAAAKEPPKIQVGSPALRVERTAEQASKPALAEAPQIAANNPEPPTQPEQRTPPPTVNSATFASPITIPASILNAAPAKPLLSAGSKYTGQPLTLDLINTALVDFFRLMAELGGINIVLDPEVKGNITIKVVKLPWDQVFEAALINNDLDKQVEGNLIRIAKKSTLQNEAKQSESLKKANLLAADLETRIKRLNYAQAKAMVKALEEQKTVRGTVVVDERTNALILTDIPSSLDRLYSLIETLDAPQPQVEIEARIVSATRDFARDIGVQFGFVQGNLQRISVGGPNTFGTIGGTRPSATPNSTYAAGNGATGRGAAEGKASASGAVSAGGSGNYNVNLPATKAFGGLGLSIGNIFDTFLLDAAITAGESKGKAKLISQPKVIAQNNSPAVIQQGIRFPVQTVSNNTVSIQFFNAALTLTVTPQITYEGNIILDLKVENNSADFGNMVNSVPSIRTSETTTRILISDGGTTIIGGILVDEQSDAQDRIPGLGSLPLLGNLFRRNSVTHNTQEVLFIVTPRIVK